MIGRQRGADDTSFRCPDSVGKSPICMAWARQMDFWQALMDNGLPICDLTELAIEERDYLFRYGIRGGFCPGPVARTAA